MTTNTLGNLSPEAKQFYDREMLLRARQSQIAYPFSYLDAIPMHGGNQVSWRRFNAYSLATTALTEGVAPASAGISLTEVTATVSQYGNFSQISDQLYYMGIDDLLSEASLAFGQNGGESIDSIIMTQLGNGTTITYATGSSKGAISASNPITAALIRTGLENLEVNNALKFGGEPEDDLLGVGGYVLFVHPHQVYDIYNDSEIKNALQYGNKADDNMAKIWTGHIASFYGVEIFKSTLAPVFLGVGSGNANVYGAIMIAKQAFACLDVAGTGKFQLEDQPFGSGGATGDPLSQIASIGWKAFQAPTILNQNFLNVILTGATHG
jgi:N4-gp56 family major capsid protein